MAATGGQTINDRINAVRYALVGQGLARTVCKATTEEVLGPKKKHIDYLLACTNEPNVSIPQMANLLIERTQHSSWAVVFKSLTTIHHLMSFGNERFSQYLATSNHSFELNEFMDRTTPQGYNMSTFVRNYSKYINDKTISYRTLAFDTCKIKPGNDNVLRTMNMDNLSKTLPVVHRQFDSLLEFNADLKDLNNGIIMAAFRLLYKDLVRLYVAYQQAIINLLERYFKLSRKKTREALEMYKKYLAHMNKVEGFLKVVDLVGLDKSEMPDLTKSPGSILKLLEQHLATLEAKKRGKTPASPETGDAGDDNDSNNEKPQQESSEKVEEFRPKEAQESKPKIEQVEPVQKQASPQKPARPSPRSSPKAEAKSVPPERPAKPPSRPPPPSAAAEASKAPIKTPTKDASSKARPTPPPHPPPPSTSHSPVPPHPAPPTKANPEPAPAIDAAQGHEKQDGRAEETKVSSSETEVTPETTEQASENREFGDQGSVANGDADQGEREASSHGQTSCEATASNADQQQLEGQQGSGEVNHLNNNSNHHQQDSSADSEVESAPVQVEEDELPPPPPPPIDNDGQGLELAGELAENRPATEQQQADETGDEPALVNGQVNGQVESSNSDLARQ